MNAAEFALEWLVLALFAWAVIASIIAHNLARQNADLIEAIQSHHKILRHRYAEEQREKAD